jgi:hypothetical protein
MVKCKVTWGFPDLGGLNGRKKRRRLDLEQNVPFHLGH